MPLFQTMVQCLRLSSLVVHSRRPSTFLCRNGILQALAAPYHPATNGEAEHSVHKTKKALKKMTGPDVDTRLTQFLFQ